MISAKCIVDEKLKSMKVSEILQHRLDNAFAKGKVVLQTHDEVHFSVYIKDGAFNGLSKIAQHRLVYDAVGEMMGKECHALTIETEGVKDLYE